MPQIPTVAAPTLTPPPEINTRIAGQAGNAMAGAAQEFEGLAEYGVQETNLLKKAQDEGIMLAAENQIGADMEHAETQLQSWTDYTHANELKQQTADSLREKYVEQYGNRPDLWRHIEPYLGRQLNGYNGLVDRRSTALTVDFNKGAFFDSQLRAENDAANEPTLEGKEKLWADQDDNTDVMVRNGTLRADEGEMAKKQLRSRTIAIEVDRASNPLNSSEIMQEEMKRLEQYEGKGYIDPQSLEQMQDHLSRSYEMAVNREERADVSKIGDAVISSDMKDPVLKDPSTGEVDYLKAAQRVDENPDLSTKVKKYVREEYEQRDTLQKKIVNERDQQIFESLDDRIGNPHAKGGALTPSEVEKRRDLPPNDPNFIPQRVADHALKGMEQTARENRIENNQERALAKQEHAEQSGEIAGNYMMQIASGMILDPMTVRTTQGITSADSSRVVAAITASKTDKNYQDAMNVIANNFPIPKTASKTDADRTAAEYDETVQEWQQLVNQHPEQDKREIAKQVLEPKIQKSIADKVNQIYGFEGPIQHPLMDWFRSVIEGKPTSPPPAPVTQKPSVRGVPQSSGGSTNNGLAVGTVRPYQNADWKFKGGDQHDPSNWEKQ